MKMSFAAALAVFFFATSCFAQESAQEAGATAAANAMKAGGGMSADFLNKGLADFQQTIGMSATPESSPTNGGTGSATVRVNGKFQISCGSTGTQTGSIGPLGFLVTRCTPGALGAAATAEVGICTASLNAGLCQGPQDFDTRVSVSTLVPASLESSLLSLECPEPKLCLLKLTGTFGIGASDASMRGTASSVAAKSNFLTTLRESFVESGEYTKNVPIVGALIKEAAPLNGGVGACSTAARSCLQFATAQSSYKRTCERQIPVTERTRGLVYDKRLTCEVITTVSKAGAAITTNSCAPSTGPATTEGYTQVGGTRVTSQRDEDTTVTTLTQYWVDMSSVSVKSETFKPLPMLAGGTCDIDPASPSRSVGCSGEWFGRTLTAAECQGPPIEGVAAEYLGGNYLQKEGCGFCMETIVNEACNGDSSSGLGGVTARDTCDDLEQTTLQSGDSCTLSSVVVTENLGGIATAQQESYVCTHAGEAQCIKWSEPSPVCGPSSESVNLLELDRIKVGGASNIDGSFNNALVAAALMDGTARGLEGSQSPTIPRLFNGDTMRCRMPVGGLGQLLRQNCCRSDLQRPTKGTIIQGGCDMEEVKLSAARRSSYARKLPGEFCSRQVKTWFFSFCLERTARYCVFPGILPRLIQEQGREQLNALAGSSSDASIQRSSLSFPLYDTTAQGGWTPVTAVNGVRIAAYKWPNYCKSQEEANKVLLNDPNAKDCPTSVSVWLAACDLPGGCDALPGQPSEGGFNWSLMSVNPLEASTTAISKFAIAKGSCNTSSENCAYEISAWPVGQGGRAVVSKTMSWPLFDTNTGILAQAGTPTAADYQMNNMGDLMFKGYPTTGTNGSLPATVRLDFSSDGGQTWRSINLPTDLRAVAGTNDEFAIPDSDVKVSGFCDVTRNLCEYRTTGTVAVSAKPWGNVHAPDCSGFSPGQLAVLDFSKMDLSEWLNTVMDKMAPKDPGALAGQAAQQFAAFNAQFNGGAGTVTASNPSGANFARVTPAEGFGPFTATLSVSGYWPETTGDPTRDLLTVNRVQRVEVDWGVCATVQALSPIDPSLGTGFRGSMTYAAPDEYPCLFQGGNTVHKIKIAAYTADGNKHEREVSVENAWSKFPGATSNRANVSSTLTKPASSIPKPPTAP